MAMRFEIIDAYREGAEPAFTGEAEDDGTITKIEATHRRHSFMLSTRKNDGFDVSTLEGIAKALPRFYVYKEGEDGYTGSVQKDGEVYEGNIVKLDPSKKQVFGWAYVSHDNKGEVMVDRSGEFVDDVEVLEKAAYDYVLKSRKGGAEHKRAANEVIHESTMIESMVFTPEKIAKMGIPAGTIPQGAWWVGYQIHNDEVWRRFENKELTSFSIHGSGLKKAV